MNELHNLYETAIQIIEKTISLGMSEDAIETTSVSALLTDKGNIYTGLNGSRLENNVPTKTCSEYEAVTAMMMSGENRIIGIVSVAFKNRQVTLPCEKCRELICRINPQNITCGVMTDENTALSLQMLINQSVEKRNNQVSDMDWHTGAEFWGNDDEASMFGNNPNFNNNNNQFPSYYNNNNNAGYPYNGQRMNNYQQPGRYNNNMNNGYYPQYDNGINMNNGYYQQNNPRPSGNQNPYDYVQPVPPSSIQRSNAINRYANVSGNIYVHSSVNSQYTSSGNVSVNTSDNVSMNTSGNIDSNESNESANSIYKQKLKDLLSADTSEIKSDDEESGFYDDEDSADRDMRIMAKMDAKYTKKAAKKLAKANKKANKKSIFDRFI